MAESNLKELIAELQAAFRAIPNGVRALLGPGLLPEAQVTQLGECEKVEESKFKLVAPCVPKPEENELPELYGRTRLVLLVTGSYQVHAYWEVTPESLAAAEGKIVGIAPPHRNVLRFYDEECSEPDRFFDIEIDVAARNSYVDLWSADKAYRAELGQVASEGTFVALARSNSIRTPRAWPKVEPEEHFMRIQPKQKAQDFIAATKSEPALFQNVDARAFGAACRAESGE